MSLRIGLAGLVMARGFIETFNAWPDTRVTALCDINAALLDDVGTQAGISARYIDFDAMMQEPLDAVVLATPIQVHGSQAISALRHGKHVLCQYVAANTPEEGEELVRAAQASGKSYMFIETDCYERNNMVMMALARQGVFGSLNSGSGYYMHDCRGLGFLPDGALTWRGQLWQQGFGGISAAVHSAMPLLELFNERVAEVMAYGPGARMLPQMSWYDRLTTVAWLPSGRTLDFNLDIFSPQPAQCGYRIQGTQGCFAFDRGAFAEDHTWVPVDDLVARFLPDDPMIDAGGHHSAWTAIIHTFLRALESDTRPPQDLYDALHITAIGWAADESIRRRRPVEVVRFAGDPVRERVASQ